MKLTPKERYLYVARKPALLRSVSSSVFALCVSLGCASDDGSEGLRGSANESMLLRIRYVPNTPQLPAYEIRIQDPSTAEFVGIRNVHVPGISTMNMSRAQRQEVVELIRKSGLLSMEQPEMDPVWLHSSVVPEIEVSLDGRRKGFLIHSESMVRAIVTLRRGIEAVFPIRDLRCPYFALGRTGYVDVCALQDAEEEKYFVHGP